MSITLTYCSCCGNSSNYWSRCGAEVCCESPWTSQFTQSTCTWHTKALRRTPDRCVHRSDVCVHWEYWRLQSSEWTELLLSTQNELKKSSELRRLSGSRSGCRDWCWSWSWSGCWCWCRSWSGCRSWCWCYNLLLNWSCLKVKKVYFNSLQMNLKMDLAPLCGWMTAL